LAFLIDDCKRELETLREEFIEVKNPGASKGFLVPGAFWDTCEELSIELGGRSNRRLKLEYAGIPFLYLERISLHGCLFRFPKRDPEELRAWLNSHGFGHLSKGIRWPKKRKQNENCRLEISWQEATNMIPSIFEDFKIVWGNHRVMPQHKTNRVQRFLQELDSNEPHAITEDFTFKRPYAFSLLHDAKIEVTTWRQMFELVCQQLSEFNPERFKGLPDSDRFATRRGHKLFSRNPKSLRLASYLGEGIYAEINLSANWLCNSIVRLLDYFGIPRHKMKVFLREDRTPKSNERRPFPGSKGEIA